MNDSDILILVLRHNHLLFCVVSLPLLSEASYFNVEVGGFFIWFILSILVQIAYLEVNARLTNEAVHIILIILQVVRDILPCVEGLSVISRIYLRHNLMYAHFVFLQLSFNEKELWIFPLEDCLNVNHQQIIDNNISGVIQVISFKLI